MTTGKEKFKQYLKKIGSGENTSSGLNRKESEEAFNLILHSDATPAQIGAFMIAHRIRRPEPQELAGMVDAYVNLGPTLTSKTLQLRPICFGIPFDGRTRTAPIYPLTALILVSAGQPVVLQGSDRMPIKYGITTAELFEALDLKLTGLSNSQVQNCLDENGLAFIYQPDHFALAQRLKNYRDEIGKRPPIASMELIWTAHQGEHLFVSGFVHPPTEERAWEALKMLGESDVISIKGLEGGTDLPISRPCITGQLKNNQSKRLILHPKDHGCSGKDMEWINLHLWRKHALDGLTNKGPLQQALRWNAGVYLWFAGISQSLEAGLDKAEEIMSEGSAKCTLEQLIHWRSKITA